MLDAQRHETRVTLTDVKLGGSYPSNLFEFVDPRFFQNNGGRDPMMRCNMRDGSDTFVR